jgi:tight adherence protein C
MLLLIAFILCGSFGMLYWGFFGNTLVMGRIKLPEGEQRSKKMQLRKFLASIVPSRRVLEKTRLDSKLKNKLNAAHVRLSPIEYFNLKLLVAAFGGFFVFLITSKLDPLIMIGAAVGYLLPDFWLKRKIKQRREIIAKILPETVDLLGLCVEAGLDFTTSVKWLIEKTPMNPMIEELAFVLEEIKWGKARTQALKDMSRRLEIPEVSSFVQTLVQAERMGTPVSEAFLILSEDTRLQRFHRGERFAMQAPIKILIPLIFCILPVIAIIIGGPILLKFSMNKMF